MKTRSLLFGFCLFAQVAFGADIIPSFAKQNLALDLASVPFGQIVQTNSGYGLSSPPLTMMKFETTDAGLSWMTNVVSEKYHQEFSDRVMVFGFRDGRLAAVRITINSLPIPDYEESRKSLLHIYDELHKVSPTRSLSFEDGGFRITVDGICGLTPELLLVMGIQITPVEAKKDP